MKKIINHLEGQKEYRLNNKKYQIYKDLLLCEELIDTITLYKVVIPEIMAHSFVMQCHYHFNHIIYFNHIKHRKLFNQISLKFEIGDLQNIINIVVKFCFVCSLTGKVPAERNKSNITQESNNIKAKMFSLKIR